MDADAYQAGALAEAPPYVVNSDDMSAGALAGTNEGVTSFSPGCLRKQCKRRRAERHGLAAGLAVGKVQAGTVPIDVVPLQGKHLTAPHAGQGEEPNGEDHCRHLGARALR